MNKFFIFVVLFVSLSLVFAFGGVNKPPGEKPQIHQAFTERSAGNFDAVKYLKNQQDLFDWLMAESITLSPDSVITIHVSEADLESVENYDCENCGGIRSAAQRVRIGLVKPVGKEVSFPNSRMEAAPSGGFVWTAAVESKKAAALRVHFTDLSLPPDAELYIYNVSGEAFGPYTGSGPNGDGDLWSNTVTGPMAYIQLRYFGMPTESDLNSTHFVIADVGHLTEKFRLPFLQYLDKTPVEGLSMVEEHCSNNASCVEDASCYSNSAINDAKDAVAHMQWVSGPWLYYCSGGLLADSDPGSQIPYFLTANHCISKSKDAKALECYFQYWTASCHGACYDPVGAVPRTLGADVLSTNRTGDYTLMRLKEDPPSGSAFMGWTDVPIAYTANADLYRISHPDGSPQAYSKHRVDAEVEPCGGWPRGSWIYSRDVIGATEGGSSGSPVLNAAGQVVGQLSGACGYNLNDVCDSESNATVDGAFASYYSEVEPWLGSPIIPEGEMHVDSIVLSIKKKGKKTEAIATVTILDEYGSPVSGAVVSGTFTGDASGTASGTTDASGEVTIKLSVQGTVSGFTFCVDNVTHASMTYDPSANVETCDSY